jgi:putative hydrolase of the HAD superfamily
MHYELVLSDLGGVVVDFHADRIVLQVSQLVGKPFDEVQAAIYHEDLLLPLEIGKVSPKTYYEGLKSRLGFPWTYEQFVRSWNDIFSENAEVVQIMQRLRARHKIVALTNTNQLHITHIKAAFPSLSFFTDWVASCEVGVRKPEPEIYQLALARTGVRAERTVYIDDRPEMVEAGRAVGLRAIRFENSRQLEQDLQAIGLNL